MKSIRTANYNSNEIRIENGWLEGEHLFVNGKLQDKKWSIFSSDLSGHLESKTGDRLLIKAHIGGYFKLGCKLSIGDKKIEVIQLK